MTEKQVWFITGANRGLGRALTMAALDAGHAVIATVRGAHSLPDHPHLEVMRLDVRERSNARAAVAQVVERHGRLDVLVNNAGVGLVGGIEEVSEADVRATVETNVYGPLWFSQAVIPVMRQQRAGCIVQISTVGAAGTMPLLGVYNATKWALEAFSESMAAEVASYGVRVLLIEPGSLDTDWAGSSMRFSDPIDAYDALRTDLFGVADVPWPESNGGWGMPPADAAAEILARVADGEDGRLRVLVGDDAPAQVSTALEQRQRDYARDPRWKSGPKI